MTEGSHEHDVEAYSMKVSEQVVAQPGSMRAAQAGDHASLATLSATAHLHMSFRRIILTAVDVIQLTTELEDGFAKHKESGARPGIVSFVHWTKIPLIGL